MQFACLVMVLFVKTEPAWSLLPGCKNFTSTEPAREFCLSLNGTFYSEFENDVGSYICTKCNGTGYIEGSPENLPQCGDFSTGGAASAACGGSFSSIVIGEYGIYTCGTCLGTGRICPSLPCPLPQCTDYSSVDSASSNCNGTFASDLDEGFGTYTCSSCSGTGQICENPRCCQDYSTWEEAADNCFGGSFKSSVVNGCGTYECSTCGTGGVCPNPPCTEDELNGCGPSTGVIVGIVIGCIVAVCLIGVGVAFCCCNGSPRSRGQAKQPFQEEYAETGYAQNPNNNINLT